MTSSASSSVVGYKLLQSLASDVFAVNQHDFRNVIISTISDHQAPQPRSWHLGAFAFTTAEDQPQHEHSDLQVADFGANQNS